MAGFEISGISGFESAVDTLIAAIDTATRTGIVAAATEIEAQAKDRVPVKSKSLYRSIQVIGTPVSLGTGSYSIRVAPTLIYGRRIELGFHGVDSLGRNYGPPNKGYGGHPYLGPAVSQSGTKIREIMAAWWGHALNV